MMITGCNDNDNDDKDWMQCKLPPSGAAIHLPASNILLHPPIIIIMVIIIIMFMMLLVMIIIEDYEDDHWGNRGWKNDFLYSQILKRKKVNKGVFSAD